MSDAVAVKKPYVIVANKNVPQVQEPRANLNSLVATVRSLRQGVESLGGYRGDMPGRAVTFNDLTGLGLITPSGIPSNSDLEDLQEQIDNNNTPVGVFSGDTPPEFSSRSTRTLDSNVRDLWFDSVSCQLFVWYEDLDSGQWVIANSGAAGGGGGGIEEAPLTGQLYARSDTGWVAIPRVTVGPTPPSAPAIGDVWIDTN